MQESILHSTIWCDSFWSNIRQCVILKSSWILFGHWKPWTSCVFNFRFWNVSRSLSAIQHIIEFWAFDIKCSLEKRSLKRDMFCFTQSQESLYQLITNLRANALSVHSNLGGGNHGHLGLVMTPAQYNIEAQVPYQTSCTSRHFNHSQCHC